MTKRSSRTKTLAMPALPRTQALWATGGLLVLVGVLTITSLLFPDAGTVTQAWQRALRSVVGIGIWITPAVFLAVGLWTCTQATSTPWPWPALPSIGMCLTFVTGLGLCHHLASPDRVENVAVLGGTLGREVSTLLARGLGWPGALIVLLLLVFLGVLLFFGIEPDEFVAATVALVNKAIQALNHLVARWRAWRAKRTAEPVQQPLPTPPVMPPPPPPELGAQAPSPTAPQPVQIAPPAQPIVTRSVSTSTVTVAPEGDPEPDVIEKLWVLPNLHDMLVEADEGQISLGDIREKTRVIEETLNSLGVPVSVKEVNPGPVVTQFGIEPGYVERRDRKGQVTRQKIKVAKISALSNDLALALASASIRIEAPVPGKGIVGLEVPNDEIATVRLRGVIESAQFANMAESHLAVALGRDVSGAPLVADLAKLPHLLIAGATGSGKSVCINTLITCLLLRNTPDQLRLLMVDPKRVELSVYNGIPHLLAPVVVKAEKVVGVLNWVAHEMDQRYREFAKVGARNITTYNQLATERGDKPLPFIVVFIDELADLMMVAPDDVERAICRIAQMARATGIHLVIATQRPSVDVVTGLIKANFPARIAFAVSSAVDSRVIIDTPGADKLLGKGDSLYMAPDSAKLQRMQGCFLTDHEITRLVDHWREQANGQPEGSEADVAQGKDMVQQAFWPEENDEKAPKDQDPLLRRATAIVREQNRASVSMLQRNMRIGYTRAARLIDTLEEAGVIGPATGSSRAREVYPEPPPGQGDPDQETQNITDDLDTDKTEPIDIEDKEIPW